MYAVRKDWYLANQGRVSALAKAILDEQKVFTEYLDNIARKKAGDALKTKQFKSLCRPLSGIFLFDEAAVDDYILWLGIDSELAGYAGNKEFFLDTKNPVGFAATNKRIQDSFFSKFLCFSINFFSFFYFFHCYSNFKKISYYLFYISSNITNFCKASCFNLYKWSFC